MSKSKSFTGPLAEHIQKFLDEKRALVFKYEEQERVLLHIRCRHSMNKCVQACLDRGTSRLFTFSLVIHHMPCGMSSR